MFNTFFVSLETTVNSFWQWFFVQEKKFSRYPELPDKLLAWLERSVDRFWQRFYTLEERFYSKTLVWLTIRHKILAIILIWLGLNSLIIQGLYANYQRKILSFQVTPVAKESLYRAALPVKLAIGGIGVDLSVVEASIVDGVWQTSDNSATHLAASARPGESSNIVIYGHNRPELLNSLHEASVGEEITLESEAGVRHTYVVEKIEVVAPSAIEYVLPTADEQLTVYTCTGLFDSQRLVLVARPSQVSSL
ncbi:MAG TPA: sortase [Patescibacteria group bacterium]